MKRSAGALLLTAALSGCMSIDHGPQGAGPVKQHRGGGAYTMPTVPGLVGPWGEGVTAMAPYRTPMTPHHTAQMLNSSVPLNMVAMNGGPSSSGIQQVGGTMPSGPMGGMAMPPGMPPMPPGMMGGMPPMPPGMMGGMAVPPGGLMGPPGMPPAPGMGGPGGSPAAAMLAAASGKQMAQVPPVPPGAFPNGPPRRYAVSRTQVRFTKPSGMKIAWFSVGMDGKPAFSAAPLETPGRYNFVQGAIYRLKLSGIEGRPGLELYPTLEVVPTNPHTEAFLAHNAVPVEFTDSDFKEVAEGNYIVKVIYLPHAQFQELAATGIDEIISTRLEPGADPIKEALRRGSILLVIRMGNMDQEAPNTPPIDAPPPGGMQKPGMMPPGMMPPGMMPPGGGLPQMAPGFGAPGGGPGGHGPMMGNPPPMVPYSGGNPWPTNPNLTPQPTIWGVPGRIGNFPSGGGMPTGTPGPVPGGMPTGAPGAPIGPTGAAPTSSAVQPAAASQPAPPTLPALPTLPTLPTPPACPSGR